MIKKLDEKEILRYLGYRAGSAADAETAERIRRCGERLLACAAPRYTAQVFSLRRADGRLALEGSAVRLLGRSIEEHLSGCGRCVLMAATLGIEADRAIRQTQLTDMAEAVVMDACATAYIEAFCDEAEREINEAYGPCNFRFSPGYGDFPLAQQSELLRLLEAEKWIGLCVNDGGLLIPGKSVTAVLGITGRSRPEESKCDRCPNRESCAFAKDRKGCVNER